jgi:hypothetical protein
MKRRVLSKTTPFHPFKKKKKGKRAERCRFERHCSSFFFPPNMQRGRREKWCFFLKFLPAPLSLTWSPPTEHNGRPPTAHHPPNLGSRAQWPTSRLLPARAVKNSALGLYK